MAPPRVQIPVHVFAFGLALTPAVVYAYYYQKHAPTDEDFEKELRGNYAANIQSSKARRQDMVKFFEGIKKPGSDANTEERLAEVLRGGRTEAKRHYAVDEELYGTEKGVEMRRQAEEEARKQKEERVKGKRKRKKADKEEGVESVIAAEGSQSAVDSRRKENLRESQSKDLTDKGITKEDSDESSSRSIGAGMDTRSVVAITVVGTVAAGVGFLLGGRRSQ